MEVKLARDASKCRPCTPAYDDAIMGMPRRTGAEQGSGNAPSTSEMKGTNGDGGEMEWLNLEGSLDDPLTHLLVRCHSIQSPPTCFVIDARVRPYAAPVYDECSRVSYPPSIPTQIHPLPPGGPVTFLFSPSRPSLMICSLMFLLNLKNDSLLFISSYLHIVFLFFSYAVFSQNMEQDNHQASAGGSFALGDDLFNMPVANPSGMFAGGGSNASPQLRATTMSELKSAIPGHDGGGSQGQLLSMDIGTIGENQVKVESATSGASDTTQFGANGGSAVAGGQHMGTALGGGPQGEVEAVLTRPFATSALRHAQLQRYRAKRLARHLGHKKIRYECRKTLADNRPRIKGRFAKVHVGDDAPGDGKSALTTAQSCPDLTALARLEKEVEGSEDSSNKKSRLGNTKGSTTTSTAAGGTKSGAAAKKKSPSKKAAAAAAAATAGGGGNGGNGGRVQFAKGSQGEQMADNALIGELGEWGNSGDGDGSVRGGLGHLRGGAGRVGMPYTQSEVSLVALDRAVW